MAALKASSSLFSPNLHQKDIKSSIIQNTKFSVPSLQVNNLVDELKTQNISESMLNTSTQATTNSNVVEEMYAVVEAVSDRVEMHKNIGEQRNNWNYLLLTSVNGMITTAAIMAGLAAMNGVGEATLLALKLSSTSLYIAATGILMIMNKIQPSQLAEEQRNASRLFKQLHEELKTAIALGKVNSKSVENAMRKVLALDKAYPLPLIGVMLDKFPKRVEPAVWWPKHVEKHHGSDGSTSMIRYSRKQKVLNLSLVAGEVAENGWNEELEDEMKKVMGVMKRKDEEDYIRLAKIALNINKILAISGPVLTGLAAIGSACVGWSSLGTWPILLGIVCGALGIVVNTLEHGGQVGMVFEMYRSSAGFFRLMEENIESALEEEEADRRENGQVFEAKVALELGRSLSELRNLAHHASSSSSKNPNSNEEFASKLF